MRKYDDNPEQAEAEIQAAARALSDAEDKLAVALEREEQIVDEVDEPYSASRHAAIEAEIETLREAVESASQDHDSVVESWGF